MAVKNGVNGAVYWNEELTNIAVANTISFNSTGYSIVSSAIDFETEGYKASMLFSLSGATSTGNNRTFTIATVSSGTITVSSGETIISSTGDASTGITFLEADPGFEELGFYNWTINYKIDLFDTTAFDTSSGGRSYLANITNWTASAEKFFITGDNTVNEEWLGATVKVRFFIDYQASPSTGSPAIYYQGDTIVTGINEGTPVDALITQGITFQGVGALTPVTRTTAWNS